MSEISEIKVPIILNNPIKARPVAAIVASKPLIFAKLKIV